MHFRNKFFIVLHGMFRQAIAARMMWTALTMLKRHRLLKFANSSDENYEPLSESIIRGIMLPECYYLLLAKYILTRNEFNTDHILFLYWPKNNFVLCFSTAQHTDHLFFSTARLW